MCAGVVQLSLAIRYFIRRKLKEDSDWQQFKVIFSGSDVPLLFNSAL
jgi:5'-3' exonuclease